ncbi:hypothetical protein P170DRAFT_262678 [Aspergillus steynii IBT 23096]|uniref:Uncharacterized protein n=1 Tax=Aspergillus steynii IBT 23096 TaxID=1392250 RepID=A0A2I2G010_9EURO|nr:uncharacterized protein P170DRAFT_262678 [Aspergillus steynii IBT 23096]PLB46204.1 hypothetical protein P170DRAFT_262678 [Aspergillus steynii IBT 23096]
MLQPSRAGFGGKRKGNIPRWITQPTNILETLRTSKSSQGKGGPRSDDPRIHR